MKLPNLLIKVKYFIIMTRLNQFNLQLIHYHCILFQITGLNQIKFKTFKSFLIPGVMQLKTISATVIKLAKSWLEVMSTMEMFIQTAIVAFV